MHRYDCSGRVAKPQTVTMGVSDTNEPSRWKSMPDMAIVATDISGWTKTCYEAKRQNKMDDLVSAFVDYQRKYCEGVSHMFADLANGATTGIANHTGDGFIFLSNNVDGAENVAENALQGFALFEEKLEENQVPVSPIFRLRISLHYGDVWEYNPFRMASEADRTRLVDENGKTRALTADSTCGYLGDDINLVCRMCSCDMARRHIAVCSRKFYDKASWCHQYVHELADTDFCGRYPESVRVYGIDW